MPSTGAGAAGAGAEAGNVGGAGGAGFAGGKAAGGAGGFSSERLADALMILGMGLSKGKKVGGLDPMMLQKMMAARAQRGLSPQSGLRPPRPIESEMTPDPFPPSGPGF